MKDFNKRFFDKEVILMGFLHTLVAFTAMTVVTTVLGFNLPLALLFSGIGTFLFHVITNNKLPVTLGVSAAYIGSILSVTQTYGKEYALGGVVAAGVMYIVFGLVMMKWQDKILKFFPDWLLSTVVLMIALSLIPVGLGLTEGAILVGVVSLVVVSVVDMFGSKTLSMFSLPIGVLIGTLVSYVVNPVFPELVSTGFEYVSPRFNIASVLSIGLIALPTMFEMLGDTKNTGDIIGENLFEKVGIARISFGNGVATILGGFGGANAYTTYSENAGFLMLSGYHNADAQYWTALFFIILSFFTPALKLVQLIPQQVFGGVMVYLFSMIAVNSIKQIGESVSLGKDTKTFSIITLMVALSFVPFTFGSVSVSSVAISTVVGVVLNIFASSSSIQEPEAEEEFSHPLQPTILSDQSISLSDWPS